MTNRSKFEFIIALILLLILNLTVSESKIDSILTEIKKKTGNDQIDLIVSTIGQSSELSYEDRELLYRMLFDQSYKLGDKYTIAKTLSNYGYFLTMSDRYYEAIDSIEKSRQIFEQLGRTINEAFTISQLSLLQQRLSNYDKALELSLSAYTKFDKDLLKKYLKEFMTYDDKMKDSINRILKGYTIITTDFGLLFYELDDLDAAQEKFQECLEIARTIGDINRIAGTLSNLAMIENQRDNTDLAIKLYEEAIENAQKVNNLNYIANIQNNIGNIYSFKNEHTKAIEYYQKAIDYYLAYNIKSGYVTSLLNISLSYSNIKEYDKALEFTKFALDTAVAIGSLTNMARGAFVFSTIYAGKGDYKQAYDYSVLYKQYDDSLNSKIYSENMSKLRSEMELDKIESEISLLSAANSKKKTQSLFLVVTLILIVILAIVLMNRYLAINKLMKLVKTKNQELITINQDLQQNKEKLEELITTKDKFLSIIAHDIRNPLSLIIGVSGMIHERYASSRDQEYYILNEEIHDSAKNLNELLQNLLLWSLAQSNMITFNPEHIEVKSLFSNIINLFKMNAGHKSIEIKTNANSNITLYCDLNMMSTILRNIVGNAIKYSHSNSEIHLNIHTTPKTTTIEITDFGIGMTPEKISMLESKEKIYTVLGTHKDSGSGLGMLIVNELLAYHKANLEIKSVLGNGSTFLLHFPN